MAQDTSLKILDANISIQEAAFLKMQALKRYAKTNQLAVNRFEAQLNKTKKLSGFKPVRTLLKKRIV